MMLQFGYVVLFSGAFPLAALCALINNLFEGRGDAFKLCNGLQRPFSKRVKNIGVWQVLLALDTDAVVCRFLLANEGLFEIP